jgi:hypothetical protein
MIFLGAGASKTFGIKTLQEMTQDLIKLMDKEGYGDFVNEIKERLARFGITPDFEAIYAIVEGITNLKDTVKYYGPFAAYICRDISQVKPKQDFNDLLKTFKSYLYSECMKCNQELIESVYDRLFEISKKSGAHEKRYGDGSELGQEPSVNVDYTIVTTNYDMIVEFYHRIKKEDFADGFRQTGDPLVKELDLSTYSRKRHRWLIKLHGSIWQYRHENYIFKTNEDPRYLSISVKIQEEMMIYPTGEKPILKHPYYEFHNLFKFQKWNKLIAIGYSFRDEPVNIAIIENLERVPHSNLIVVNPNPETVLKNLGDSVLSKFGNRIIRIKGKFGDERVFVQLPIALKVESDERFKVRLREKKDELSELFGRDLKDL